MSRASPTSRTPAGYPSRIDPSVAALVPAWRPPDDADMPDDTNMIAQVGPPEAEAGGILTIDLGAIVANWRALGARAATAACAAVVKADAYGCGIEQVVPVLANAGCGAFFVAHLDEA